MPTDSDKVKGTPRGVLRQSSTKSASTSPATAKSTDKRQVHMASSTGPSASRNSGEVSNSFQASTGTVPLISSADAIPVKKQSENDQDRPLPRLGTLVPKQDFQAEHQNQSWMAHETIAKRTFLDILLPGSHSSASWDLARDMPGMSTLNRGVASIGTAWLCRQDRPIYSQLMSGIRSLDIGISRDSDNALLPLAISHGFPFAPITQVLEEIAGFLSRSPTEVVLLHLHDDVQTKTGFEVVDPEEVEFWVALYLGKYLGVALDRTITVHELQVRKQNAIYFWNGKERCLPVSVQLNSRDDLNAAYEGKNQFAAWLAASLWRFAPKMKIEPAHDENPGTVQPTDNEGALARVTNALVKLGTTIQNEYRESITFNNVDCTSGRSPFVKELVPNDLMWVWSEPTDSSLGLPVAAYYKNFCNWDGNKLNCQVPFVEQLLSLTSDEPADDYYCTAPVPCISFPGPKKVTLQFDSTHKRHLNMMFTEIPSGSRENDLTDTGIFRRGHAVPHYFILLKESLHNKDILNSPFINGSMDMDVSGEATCHETAENVLAACIEWAQGGKLVPNKIRVLFATLAFPSNFSLNFWTDQFVGFVKRDAVGCKPESLKIHQGLRDTALGAWECRHLNVVMHDYVSDTVIDRIIQTNLNQNISSFSPLEEGSCSGESTP